jgi:hypothetical protein
MTDLIDTGICCTLINFIPGLTTSTTIAALEFVNSISRASGYGRDALLCCGIHESIVQIAASPATPHELCQAACSALSHIFGNPDPVDLDTIVRFVTTAAPLIELSYLPALHSVLELFAHLTAKMPAISSILCEKAIEINTIEFLSKSELTSPALSLVGNLAVAEPKYVRKMIGGGLLESLSRLLESDHAAAVLWVFSNLIESVPTVFRGWLTIEFMQTVVELATLSFEVRCECANFLGTVLVFAARPDLAGILADGVAVLVGGCGCGDPAVAARCLDGIFRGREACDEFKKAVAATDLVERLGEIARCCGGAAEVADRALGLLEILG